MPLKRAQFASPSGNAGKERRGPFGLRQELAAVGHGPSSVTSANLSAPGRCVYTGRREVYRAGAGLASAATKYPVRLRTVPLRPLTFTDNRCQPGRATPVGAKLSR